MQNMKISGFALLLCLLASSVAVAAEYKVTNTLRNSTTVVLDLAYTGSDDYYVKPTSPIVKKLQFVFHTVAFYDFYFKIVDPTKKRFEVPTYGAFPSDPLNGSSFPISASAVSFTYSDNPFNFKITRKSNNAVLFSTEGKSIIFSDYYIEIGTEIDSQYVFGLGERLVQGFRVQDGRWSMFNRDRGEEIDTGIGIQTYGYYPFYLLKERNSQFHVSYFRGSNALDVIKESKDGKQSLTYKTIGGVIDFRFFLGQFDPEATIQKLNFYSGRAEIPPFWSMGYHQCRWGYKDINDLQKVIANFQKYDIPLDTLWSDLDYLINSEVFTLDQTKFPPTQMRKLLQNYRWIPIIDPGIKSTGEFYDEGFKRNAFILDANTKLPMNGKMRSGKTVYVDFFHPNSTSYWHDMLDKLYNKIPFSGIWLDSNEFTSFCTGRCEPPTTPALFDYNVDVPYTPAADDLEGDTISLNSTHYGGLLEADVHIYNGFLQVNASHNYLQTKGKKPFILTRSSILGSSKFSIHWTGDNKATWQFLRTSIADNFNMQLYGFQVSGADICGFADNSSEQLCARWYQMGSFYTFSRNHNERSARDQQPYAFGQNAIKSAVTNLKLRYYMLKYLYSLMVSKKGLGTIWRPLFFMYPTDSNLYIDDIMDTQFMIGPDLIFTPLLEEGKTSRKIYLPSGNWYNFHTGELVPSGTSLVSDVQVYDKIPIFLREAAAVLTQDTTKVLQTKDLNNKFTITAGLRLDSKRSNSTVQLFEAIGSILSIADYNDDIKVDTCSVDGCEYRISVWLTVTSAGRSVELDVSYVGAQRLRQSVLIQGLQLYYEGKRIDYKLEKDVEIAGPGKQVIPIPKQAEHLSID